MLTAGRQAGKQAARQPGSQAARQPGSQPGSQAARGGRAASPRIWWRSSKNTPGGQKSSLDQSDRHPSRNSLPSRPAFRASSQVEDVCVAAVVPTCLNKAVTALLMTSSSNAVTELLRVPVVPNDFDRLKTRI